MLLIGSAILLAWAWFMLGFLSEPSAVGRTRAILGLLGGGCIGVAVLGVAAAVALRLRVRWAPGLGLAAAVFMILTVVGAVIGVPAVFGLLGGRKSTKP